MKLKEMPNTVVHCKTKEEKVVWQSPTYTIPADAIHPGAKYHVTWDFGPSISPSPSSLMDYAKSAVTFLREKALPKSEKTLRKALFKNDCGQWTNEAKEALIEMLCNERKDDLLKLAEDIVKDQEDED